MTLSQVVTDVTFAAGAVSATCTLLAHLPWFSPAWSERFARVALYAANWKFSVNVRPSPGAAVPPPGAP